MLNNVNKFLSEISNTKSPNSNLDKADINKEPTEIIKKEEIKIDEKKEISNVDEFNNVTNYCVKIPDLSIDLNDFIDGEYQPIFHFLLKIDNFDFCQNNNPRDSTNLENHLKNIV